MKENAAEICLYGTNHVVWTGLMNKTMTMMKFKNSGKSVLGDKLVRVMHGTICVGTIVKTSVGFMAHTDPKNCGYFVACETMEAAKRLFQK